MKRKQRRVSAEQMAAWIIRQDRPVTPAEIRVRYGVAADTLRRRRDELKDRGVSYCEAGKDSFYQATRRGTDPAIDPPIRLPHPAIDVLHGVVDPAISTVDPAIDGRLAFVLDELSWSDGTTLREASTADPWIIDEILAPVFALGDDGLPAHSLAYFELARGHAKSSLAAAVALAECLLHPGTMVVVGASDKEQAGIVTELVDGFVQRSPLLQGLVVRAGDDRVIGDSLVRVLASDAASAWGLGSTHPRFRVIADELANWTPTAENFWQALSTSTGKVADAQVIVLSNAGFSPSGCWQWRVREVADREPFAVLFAPEGCIASWVSPTWIEQQRKLLPPSAFERIIQNRWVAETGDFLTSAQLDAITDSTAQPLASAQATDGPFFAGIDLGLTRDRTALAIVRRANDRVELVDLQTWQGSKDQPVDISAVERALLDAAHRYPGLRIFCDRWQFERSMQILKSAGLRIDKFEFTATSVQRLSECLYQSVTARRLAMHPRFVELRRELLGLVTKETPSGWRFDHRGGGFSDMAVALSMALLLAEKNVPGRFSVQAARGQIADARFRRTVTARDRADAAAVSGGQYARVPSGMVAARRRSLVLDPFAHTLARHAEMYRRDDQPQSMEQVMAEIGLYDPLRALDDAGLQRLDDGRHPGPWT